MIAEATTLRVAETPPWPSSQSSLTIEDGDGGVGARCIAPVPAGNNPAIFGAGSIGWHGSEQYENMANCGTICIGLTPIVCPQRRGDHSSECPRRVGYVYKIVSNSTYS